MAREAARGLAGEAAARIVRTVRIAAFTPGIVGEALDDRPGFIRNCRD
jgi:hypothetical protein